MSASGPGSIPRAARACARRRELAVLVLAAACVFPAPAVAEIYACAGDSVRIFSDLATHEDPPRRVISGPATGITECYSVALDAKHGELWVAHGPVSVFAAGASGNVAPLRRISGPATGLGFAGTIAVDGRANEVIVGSTGGVIATFAREADGDAAPLRSMDASAYVSTPAALFVDRIHDEVLVSGFNEPGVVYGFGRLQTGPAAPSRQPMSLTASRGLYVDPVADRVYVAGANGVSVFQRDGALVDQLPAGAAQLTSPWGVAIVGNELLVGNQSTAFSERDAIRFYNRVPLSPVLIRQINAGAPAERNLYGIATSAALACGWGNVVDDCLMVDGFEAGRSAN